MTFCDVRLGDRYKSKGEAGFTYKLICIDTGRGAMVHLKRETDGQVARLTAPRIMAMIQEGNLVKL